MEEQTQINEIISGDQPVKPAKRKLKKFSKIFWILIVWGVIMGPYLGLYTMLELADDGTLPALQELENPKSNLASRIFTEDGVEIGKFYRENRTNSKYNDLSPWLVKALVATEDERFYSHSGVDIRALGRVAKGVALGEKSSGGGSTISQQLAKMMFPREDMETWELVKRKFKEWIIAGRLERSYTKEEIVTMYFNKFDFLNNAVGINSASQVYFDKTPIELELHEAAMLVGMAKNPSYFNPLRFPERVKDRRSTVLSQMKKVNFITQQQFDSIDTMDLGLHYTRVDHQTGLAPYFRETLRREVTKLLLETKHFATLFVEGEPVKENEHLLGQKWYLTNEESFDLRGAVESGDFQSTIVLDENKFHYKLRILNVDGKIKADLRTYKYAKENGEPYDIYADGLNMYTTLDSRMQAYAEWAMQEHLKYDLQKSFFKNNARWKNPPFSNDLTDAQIDTLMDRAKRRSQLYKVYEGDICGYCERTKTVKKKDNHYVCSYCKHETKILHGKELDSIFETKRKMKVFDWQSPHYEKDTIFSVMDSIRYYKSLLRSSLVSMNPHNGHIKAWVGGPYYKHFKYDMVKDGRRQVGSTFKPFVYATALEFGIINPCSGVPDMQYCIEVPFNEKYNKLWCPSNSDAAYTMAFTPYSFALAASMNNITASIIKTSGMPEMVFNRVAQLGIDTSKFIPVPSMALGVFDLSIYEMVGAMCSFVNNGIYTEPVYLLNIEDKNGNTIYQAKQEMREVWAEETAYTMLEMLKRVTTGIHHPTLKNKEGRSLVGGTAIRIRGKETEMRPYAGIKTPIAGKTGTTQNQSDGWFMGLTPDLVTGVWTGAEDRSVRFRSLQLGMGTNMALPIWAYYMKKVYADSTLHISQGDFNVPPGITKDPLDCGAYKKTKNNPINYEGKDGLNIWGQDNGEW